MEDEFAGRRALVTGASSGIGRATALRLCSAGAIVMATGRREDALESLRAEAESLPGELHLEAGELTDNHFRETLLASTVDRLGGLDILVNAAGVIGSGTTEATGLDDFDAMMDINLRSVFALSKLAIPHLKKQKGAVVNVSSVTGTRAFPGVMSYCVSKAGVDQLTRCMALELAEFGVRVNAVNPGVVRTNLHKAGGMSASRYDDFVEHSRTTHPLGRIGEPEEVAELIAFLASPRSGFITGECVNVDGGRHQTCAR